MRTIVEAATLHKAFSLLLLSVALGSLVLATGPIVGALAVRHEDIDAERARLAGLRAKRVDLRSIEAELDSERTQATGKPLILEVASSAAAWERFERLLREIAARCGATVVSVRGLPLENASEAELKAARMEVMLRIPREGIKPLLETLEATRPLIFFEAIAMRSTQTSGMPDREAVDLTATLRVLTAIAPLQAQRR